MGLKLQLGTFAYHHHYTCCQRGPRATSTQVPTRVPPDQSSDLKSLSRIRPPKQTHRSTSQTTAAAGAAPTLTGGGHQQQQLPATSRQTSSYIVTLDPPPIITATAIIAPTYCA